VNVVSVNTLNVEGKKKAFRNMMGKRGDFKKAVVTLQKGQSIDLSSGVA
jgi:large subunit ribosomal protein L23